MLEWEHNHLSWSFGLACVACILLYINGILFLTEAKIQRRQEISQQKQYPNERDV